MSLKVEARLRRHQRIRKKLAGHEGCPRLSLYRSVRHLYAQLVDDVKGKTLFGLSSQGKEFGKTGGNVKGAKAFGVLFAKKAKAKNFSRIVFDRGGFLYHGRIKAFADGVREGGLEF